MFRLITISLFTLALLFGPVTPASAQDAPPPPPLTDEMDEPAPTPRPRTKRRRVRRARRMAKKAAATADDDSPVVRAVAKNMGMFFQVGGLANLTLAGDSHATGAAVSNEIGIKFVFSEKMMLPIFFGFGMHFNEPNTDNDDDETTNWNMFLGAGMEYHFRVWRRISPFFGGIVTFGFYDATGEDNLNFQFGIGPKFGVEYYIGDRVSITASYILLIHVNHTASSGPSKNEFVIATGNDKKPGKSGGTSSDMANGGKLTLTFYF